jgi:hypothetical protein
MEISAMTEVFKPEVGSTLFISIANNFPFLTTIVGYHERKDIRNGVVEYKWSNGKTVTAWLDLVKFFPDVPIDSNLIYSVNAEANGNDDSWLIEEISYHFDAQSAFDFIDGIANNTIYMDPEIKKDIAGYFVKVDKVIPVVDFIKLD